METNKDAGAQVLLENKNKQKHLLSLVVRIGIANKNLFLFSNST